MLALERGDLTHRTSVTSDPHLKRLGELFKAAMDKLCGVLGRSRTIPETVTQGASDLRLSVDDMAHKATSIDQAVNMSCDTMRELTDQVQNNGSKAYEIDEIARTTRDAAEASRGLVIDVMDKIETYSSEISNIMSVINDISFQTKLLALNAGVEAAHAGDAGRGFAFVAEEVRGLAQRVADSAGENKRLISDSGQEVGNGVTLVRRAGTDLIAIIDGQHTIAQKIPQIV